MQNFSRSYGYGFDANGEPREPKTRRHRPREHRPETDAAQDKEDEGQTQKSYVSSVPFDPNRAVMVTRRHRPKLKEDAAAAEAEARRQELAAVEARRRRQELAAKAEAKPKAEVEVGKLEAHKAFSDDAPVVAPVFNKFKTRRERRAEAEAKAKETKEEGQ